jgi:hypothetical protein
MKKALFVIVIFGIFIWMKVDALKNEKKPDPNSCDRESKCLVVYVSPDCSECAQVQIFLETWIENTRDSELGVKVIVGGEKKPGDNLLLAKKYGLNGVVDQDGVLRAQYKFERVPDYLLLGSKQEELLRGQRAFDWGTKELMSDEDLKNIAQ